MKLINLKFAIIAIFVIVVLAVSSSALSDANTTAIYGTVKIDGLIDDIWDKANKEDIILVDTESDLGGYMAVPTNTTGVLRTMWNEDYFYVLIEVNKHDIPLSVHYGMENKGEDNASVSIGFDGFMGANVYNGGCPYSGIFRVILNGEKSGHGTGFDRFRYDYLGKMVKTSDTSYVVEYAFPWPSDGFVLCRDSVVALDIQINVADGGKRIGVVNWSSSPASTWQDFWECGTVYLEGIDKMGYPSRTDILPKAKPETIECFGTTGFNSLNMIDGKEIATRFEIQSGTIDEITIECPSWSDNSGCLTFRLYKWNGDYISTLAAKPLIEKEFINFADNSTLSLTPQITDSIGKGEYLLWIGNASDNDGQGVGVYTREFCFNDPRVISTYYNGKATDRFGIMAKINLTGAQAIIYPDSPVTEDTTAEETAVEDTTVEDTTVEETTVEETTEEITEEESTTEEITAEETSTEDTSVEETTVADSEKETTVEEETTADEGEVAPPTADYMAIAALAAIACGIVLTPGKKK